MKNKIVIIGGGGHAKVIISIIHKLNDYEITGYTDRINNGIVLGAIHLGNDDVLKNIINDSPECSAVIGIGTVNINRDRERIFEDLKKLGYKLPALISPDSIVNEEVFIDEGSVVMDGAVINPGAKIGKGCIINTHSTVEHDCHISDFSHICPGAILSGGVNLGKHCLIGIGASVRQSINITDYCVIGAGASIVKDCIEPGVYTGVPGKLRRK